jgi:hypothetical protein
VPDRRELEVDLALVVRGTTGVQAAVADDRLERGCLPQLERVDRLDVVVAVDGDGGRVGAGAEPLPVYGGLGAGYFQDLRMQPGRLHQADQVLGGTAHLVVVRRIGRDRRDTAPLGQFGDERLGLGRDEGVDVSHGQLR